MGLAAVEGLAMAVQVFGRAVDVVFVRWGLVGAAGVGTASWLGSRVALSTCR